MSTRFGKKISLAVMTVVLALATFDQVAGQTTMGILPVNVSSVGSSVLNPRQWQRISLQMHDLLVTQLAGIGTVSKLSREHILLLLKEVPAPDPENLDAEAFKTISKKENLHYLLKCSIESIEVVEEYVQAPMRIIIVDGNNGMVFWEKVFKSNRIISDPVITEQILIEDVLKPSVNDISKEIQSLKY